MCFFKKPKETKIADPLPAPEKVAEPTEVGAARKQEDEALFGPTGVPETRVDRSATAGGVATGSGLRMV